MTSNLSGMATEVWQKLERPKPQQPIARALGMGGGQQRPMKLCSEVVLLSNALGAGPTIEALRKSAVFDGSVSTAAAVHRWMQRSVASYNSCQCLQVFSRN